MATVREVTFLGKGNSNDLTMKADDAPVKLGSVTRIILRDVGCTWEVDSDTSPGAFDWLSNPDAGYLDLHLGGEPIPPGAYSCWIILFDPTNVDGVVWEEQLRLSVVDVCSVVPPV